MKKLAKIFSIIGMISTSFSYVLVLLVMLFVKSFGGGAINMVEGEYDLEATSLTVSGANVFSIILIIVVLIFVPLIILTLIFGKKVIHSLNENKKSIFLGIMDLIFVSNVGGIFYLIWNPNRTM